jgi:hypothetical protein
VDADPAATAARQSRRIKRVGAGSICFFCGYSNPVALMVRSRTLLQEDHTYGRKRVPNSTIVLCRNCHGEVTEARMRAGIPMRRETDSKKRIALMLLARAVYLRKDAETMERLANLLLDFADPNAMASSHRRRWEASAPHTLFCPFARLPRRRTDLDRASVQIHP